MTSVGSRLPLEGVRVIDAGIMVAAPFSAALLADFGAEVIKIERPGHGDPVRQLHPHKNGVPLWWKVNSRNKKSITLDLHHEVAQDLLIELTRRSDVLVESFRPGTLEGWNLSYERLNSANRKLIMLRVSGFGQTGPYRHRAGFGRTAEAMSGLAHITGDQNGPPLHAGFPLADYTAGLFGAYAVMLSLYTKRTCDDFAGEMIDLALYEAVLRLLEFSIIEFDQLGVVRGREGNRNAYVAPVNTYETSDGVWISFTASTQNICDRLFSAIGQPELAIDGRFVTNTARLAHVDELDAILIRWFQVHSFSEVQEIFEQYELPYARVYTVEDVCVDEHVAARQSILELEDLELGRVKMQNVVPRLLQRPGAVRWAGPTIGAHNTEIYCGLLGMSKAELEELARAGVV